MTQAPTLATRNALDICAALAADGSEKVLILASNPGLGRALSERLQSTPGSECILLTDEKDLADLAAEIGASAEFSLVCVQPFQADPNFFAKILQDPGLRRLSVLQATRMGHILLQEWKIPPGSRPASISPVWQGIQRDRSWNYQEITIGNLSSLMWGFAAGRLLVLKRPDLADRCNARMRRHLFPASAGLGPAYMALRIAARQRVGAQNPVKASDSRQQETVLP